MATDAASVPAELGVEGEDWREPHEIDPAAFVRVHALEDQHRVIGHVLDAMNQPLVVFMLLVGTGGFLIAGELQTIAREVRRKAGGGGATKRATSVGSSGLGRQYRLTLLAAAGILSMEVQNSPGVDANRPAAEPVASTLH